MCGAKHQLLWWFYQDTDKPTCLLPLLLCSSGRMEHLRQSKRGGYNPLDPSCLTLCRKHAHPALHVPGSALMVPCTSIHFAIGTAR